MLLVGVVPYLVGAVLARGAEAELGADAASASLAAAGRLVMIAQIAAPTLFIMWRSGRGWAYFGLTRPILSVDLVLSIGYVLVGLLTFLVFWLGAVVLVVMVSGFGNTAWSEGTTHATQRISHEAQAMPAWLLIVTMLANGFAEELVTKAYLIPRLREFFGGTMAAVVVSAAMFASYHVYQGPFAALSILFSQVVLGWLFTRVGRLWPFAIGHGLYDLLVFSLQPW